MTPGQMSVLGNLQTFILCLVSWILVLLLLFLIPPILFLLVLTKSLVNLIAYAYHPSWTPLSALDNAVSTSMDFYKAEGRLLSNIGLVLLLDGDLGVEEVRREVEVRLIQARLPNGELKYPRLQKFRLEFMGHYYWSPLIPNLDVKNVVKEGKGTGDLEGYINAWLQRGYDEERPIWEILVFKDEGQRKTGVALKMAHALGDGYSVRLLAAELFGTKAPTFANYSKHSWISPREMLTFFGMGPYLLIGVLAALIFHSDVISEKEKSVESWISFTTVELGTIKRIRRAFGCKFNDVLLSAFGNALRKHFLHDAEELPETIPMICSREVPNRPQGICNHFTQQMFPVPIRTGDDRERLLQLISVSKESFQRATYKLLFFMAHISYFVPSFFLPTSDSSKAGVCCVLSSFPDVFDSWYLFGNTKYPLFRSFGLSGLQMRQCAFFATTVTRQDLVDITLLGNQGVFQTPEAMDRLAFYVHAEFEQLLEIAKTENQNSVSF